MTEFIAKRGKDKILAVRKYKERTTKSGLKLALQIGHTFNYDRNNDTVMTKDGPVVNEGGKTSTLELTAVASNDPVNVLLYEAFQAGDLLEFWEIDLSSPTETADEYASKYCRGFLRSWTDPAEAENLVEISTSVDIEGEPVAGVVTMTAGMTEQVRYAFYDLDPVVEVP